LTASGAEESQGLLKALVLIVKLEAIAAGVKG
jgi:hypothetical protein